MFEILWRGSLPEAQTVPLPLIPDFHLAYLRTYVVARINPVRFHKAKKGETKPAMPIAEALIRMAGAAKKFKVESVKPSDPALVAAVSGAEE
jgi:ParB family chromosome partitioning protein